MTLQIGATVYVYNTNTKYDGKKFWFHKYRNNQNVLLVSQDNDVIVVFNRNTVFTESELVKEKFKII